MTADKDKVSKTNPEYWIKLPKRSRMTHPRADARRGAPMIHPAQGQFGMVPTVNTPYPWRSYGQAYPDHGDGPPPKRQVQFFLANTRYGLTICSSKRAMDALPNLYRGYYY